MSEAETALNPEAIACARALLRRPEPREKVWPVLAAAGLLAMSSLAFATAMILAPPVVSQHVVTSAP